MKEDNESILIDKVIKGNKRNEEELYKKYYKIVYSFINYRYGNYLDIEDDVIEIMSKIFINIHKFEESKSKFRSWVLAITKNHMIDKWRTKNNGISFCDYSIINDVEYYYDHSDALETNDIFQYISTKVPVNDFNLIVRKYIEGYKVCEIGEELDLNINQVTNKITKIKKEIKKTLT